LTTFNCLARRWCVLFSHPADFTPVCTTELGRIAVHEEEFKKRGVKVLAHSCDKLKSHSDWVAVSILLYNSNVKGTTTGI
jgi:peroxidase